MYVGGAYGASGSSATYGTGDWVGGGGGCENPPLHMAVALLATDASPCCMRARSPTISALKVDTPSRTANVLALLATFMVPNASVIVAMVSLSSFASCREYWAVFAVFPYSTLPCVPKRKTNWYASPKCCLRSVQFLVGGRTCHSSNEVGKSLHFSIEFIAFPIICS